MSDSSTTEHISGQPPAPLQAPLAAAPPHATIADDAPLPETLAHAAETVEPAPTHDVTPITKVLTSLGVRTIIVVDDDVPDVVAKRSAIQLLTAPPACLAELSEKPWPEGRAERYEWVTAALDVLPFATRRAKTKALYDELALPHDWWAPVSGSLVSINDAGTIAVIPIHPREWEVHQPTLPLTTVAAGDDNHRIPIAREVLVLFDNNLSNYRAGKDGGLKLARELYTAAGDTVLCGVISRAIQAGQEYKVAWDSLLPEERDRLVLIAKDTIDDSPVDFAYRVARVALANEIMELRTQAVAAVSSAHAEALVALRKLDIDALVHAVVLRPPEEGVSEFETLVRLYSIHFADAIAQAQPNEETLQRIVRNLRSKLPLERTTVPHKLREIRRREWLIDADAINKRFAPIASGDIFSIVKPGETASRNYVLVMQSCDLQIRRSGRRDVMSAGAETSVGTLLPVRDYNGTSSAPGFVIDYAVVTENSSKDWIVAFRPVLYVPLDVLDLCAYTPSGRATLSAPDPSPGEAPLPAPLPMSLEARFKILFARVREIIATAQQAVDTNSLLWRPGTVQDVKGSVDGQTLSYGCRRVGRLQPIMAAELLGAYTQFTGRPAREMDFARAVVP